MLKILTIHEAYPGHYVQLEHSNRCPSLIRRVLSSGTFAEGWAVYTEQMMLDQGFGRGDLALRLQQLKFYLRAVVNAILDHKMHAGTMTDAARRWTCWLAARSRPRARRWARSSAPSRRPASSRPTSSAGRLLPAAAADPARDGRPIRPRAVSRGRAFAWNDPGEVSARARAGIAGAAESRCTATEGAVKADAVSDWTLPRRRAKRAGRARPARLRGRKAEIRCEERGFSSQGKCRRVFRQTACCSRLRHPASP